MDMKADRHGLVDSYIEDFSDVSFVDLLRADMHKVHCALSLKNLWYVAMYTNCQDIDHLHLSLH